ncbi:MAG: FAD:protein FMN transferase [Luteolibacter sp.]
MQPLERRARPLLGTLVKISLDAGNTGIFPAIFAPVEHVHHRMSAHLPDSDLAEIARMAHLAPVTVDPATAEVIRLSLEWAEASGGAFDPVLAGVELVHTARRPWFSETLPDRAATWRDLEVDGLQVRAARPIALDLGGVAKGYAVDLAAEVISAHGRSGVVNAGGDLRFTGEVERSVFIKRPEAAGGLFELRELPFPALATTASYGFSETGGNFDLVDSLAGKPRAGEISITVFAATCALADAMTKAVLNLPENHSADLLKRLGCCALVLAADGSFREIS